MRLRARVKATHHTAHAHAIRFAGLTLAHLRVDYSDSYGTAAARAVTPRGCRAGKRGGHVKQLPILIITVALAAGGAQACSRGERRQGGPEATADTRTPAEGVTSASAERQIITLTGCLKRDVQPGTYALMSVATAGVVDDGNRAQQERRRDM